MPINLGAARPENIRQHNLGLLLRLLHQHGELTRSALVEATGLNRSTIGALVAELAEHGIVTQNRGCGTSPGAGRPSYSVAASTHAVYGLAVDLDVGNVTVAAVGLGGDMLARRSWRHSSAAAQPAFVVERLVEASSQIAGELETGKCVGIGVGLPGIVRGSDGFVLNAPNLGWHAVPFGELLTYALGAPVRCGNDGDLAALAEHQRGAGVGYEDLVCVIGRIGVGSGIVSSGRPLLGARGYAGEVGHLSLNPQGPRCHCGRRGCLEQYAGELALLAAARLEGCAARDLPELFRQASEADPAAVRAVETVARHLAHGIRNLVNLLDPQMVLFTGHLADVLSLSGSIIQNGIAHAIVADSERPVVLTTGALTEPTLVGAAELAFENLLRGNIGSRPGASQTLPS